MVKLGPSSQAFVDLSVCVCTGDTVDNATVMTPVGWRFVFLRVGGGVLFVRKESASEATGSFPVLAWARADAGCLSSLLSGTEAG